MKNSNNFTKRDLVMRISEDTGLTQQQVFVVIQKTLDEIVDSVARGQDVEIRNFGVFEVRLSKERIGRNPNQPGSSFTIPARATVKFKPGKLMKARVVKLSKQLKSGQIPTSFPQASTTKAKPKKAEKTSKAPRALKSPKAKAAPKSALLAKAA